MLYDGDKSKCTVCMICDNCKLGLISSFYIRDCKDDLPPVIREKSSYKSGDNRIILWQPWSVGGHRKWSHMHYEVVTFD